MLLETKQLQKLDDGLKSIVPQIKAAREANGIIDKYDQRVYGTSIDVDELLENFEGLVDLPPISAQNVLSEWQKVALWQRVESESEGESDDEDVEQKMQQLKRKQPSTPEAGAEVKTAKKAKKATQC